MKTVSILLLLFALCTLVSAEDAKPIPEGAAWELRVMGVMEPGGMQKLISMSGKRRVRLGMVGTGGVSRKLLENYLSPDFTITYKLAPYVADPDPGYETHDTSQARVVFDLLEALKVPTDVTIYHAADIPKAWADAYARAGAECDIVVFYESYWDDIQPTLDAMRKSRALFIGPYGEVGDRPTKNAVQGYSAKPWMKGTIRNLLTCAPLAKRGGRILTLLDRPGLDIAVINIIAPSYYASGPGGTCPSAGVTAAVACYAFSASRSRPDAGRLADRLRHLCIIDHKLLASIPEIGKKGASDLEVTIKSMTNPPKGKRRTLDARGVLNISSLIR